jgi:hypothetical protein
MSDNPDPSIPVVADLFTPKQRLIVYLLSVLIGAAYPVVELNTDLHWGFLAGYAAWTAFIGLVAASNVPRTVNRRDDAGYTLVELCVLIVLIVLSVLYIVHMIMEH